MLRPIVADGEPFTSHLVSSFPELIEYLVGQLLEEAVAVLSFVSRETSGYSGIVLAGDLFEVVQILRVADLQVLRGEQRYVLRREEFHKVVLHHECLKFRLKFLHS